MGPKVSDQHARAVELLAAALTGDDEIWGDAWRRVLLEQNGLAAVAELMRAQIEVAIAAVRVGAVQGGRTADEQMAIVAAVVRDWLAAKGSKGAG